MAAQALVPPPGATETVNFANSSIEKSPDPKNIEISPDPDKWDHPQDYDHYIGHKKVPGQRAQRAPDLQEKCQPRNYDERGRRQNDPLKHA